MSGGRLGTLADGLRHLHRTPDLAAMRAARSPDELARLAIVPAARNLGIAAGFLPARPTVRGHRRPAGLPGARRLRRPERPTAGGAAPSSPPWTT